MAAPRRRRSSSTRSRATSSTATSTARRTAPPRSTRRAPDVRSALRLRLQVTDHADVELALDEAHDAGGLRRVDAERLGDQSARALDEVVADVREPAGRGGAVDAIDRADLVDRETVDDLVTEERAI